MYPSFFRLLKRFKIIKLYIKRKYSFAPIINNVTRTLILGSLPSDKSLTCKQYYAHPRNKFWQLISAIIGIDLTTINYQIRLDKLLENGIGLWDVVSEAYRKNSLDSEISDYVNNDLMLLFNNLPCLTTIGFNGSTAARIGMKILKLKNLKYKILILPSSSSTHTISYEAKLARWLLIKKSHNL